MQEENDLINEDQCQTETFENLRRREHTKNVKNWLDIIKNGDINE